MGKVRRVIAGGLATVMMASTTPAIGEGENGKTNDPPKTSVTEIVDEEELTIDESVEDLDNIDKYLADRLLYHLDMRDISRVYYDANIDFVKNETPFVDCDYADGDNEENRIKNKEEADRVLEIIQKHNQKLIYRLYGLPSIGSLDFRDCNKQEFTKYLRRLVNSGSCYLSDAIMNYNENNRNNRIYFGKGFYYEDDEFLIECLAEALEDENFDIEVFLNDYIERGQAHIWQSLIRPSVFCHSEKDKKILEKLFEDLFQLCLVYREYIPIVDIEAYSDLYNQLMSTSTADGLININEASTGAQYVGQKIIGDGLEYIYHDYTLTFYYDECGNYFDAYQLAYENFVPTVTVTNPINELETMIFRCQEIENAIAAADGKLITALLTVGADTKEASR